MKPHVVIIMADQLRGDVPGKGFTPNIDSIAADGVEFDNMDSFLPFAFKTKSRKSV